MLEIFKRLFISPVLLAELLILSLIVNVLALAAPLFVMQVLSRYITSGVDSTLKTLVFGVLIAALSPWQGQRLKDFENYTKPFAIGELIDCDVLGQAAGGS